MLPSCICIYIYMAAAHIYIYIRYILRSDNDYIIPYSDTPVYLKVLLGWDFSHTGRLHVSGHTACLVKIPP